MLTVADVYEALGALIAQNPALGDTPLYVTKERYLMGAILGLDYEQGKVMLEVLGNVPHHSLKITDPIHEFHR
jgi:hypothetical protein